MRGWRLRDNWSVVGESFQDRQKKKKKKRAWHSLTKFFLFEDRFSYFRFSFQFFFRMWKGRGCEKKKTKSGACPCYEELQIEVHVSRELSITWLLRNISINKSLEFYTSNQGRQLNGRSNVPSLDYRLKLIPNWILWLQYDAEMETI